VAASVGNDGLFTQRLKMLSKTRDLEEVFLYGMGTARHGILLRQSIRLMIYDTDTIPVFLLCVVHLVHNKIREGWGVYDGLGMETEI
jgi:hypothetical protein